MTDDAQSAPGWREILAPQYLTRFLFLCLGVWLNAADSLVTVTITPSIAQDIGGFRYFAWSVAAFLLASILSGAVSGRLSLRLGLRGALTASAIVYSAGCVMSAVAPDFLIFVAGRLIQGFGAGAIMALCYVATTALFPERLWARVFGAIAGVWGVATIIGPLLGGLLAGPGLWRWTFWLFAGQAMVFILAALTMIARQPKADAAPAPIAWSQLIALTLAVSGIALAGVVSEGWQAAALGVGGVAALAWMIAVNGRTPGALLPKAIGDIAGVAAAGYLMIFAFEAASVAFTVYGPALIQARHGVTPLVAGYVITAIAGGWTVTALAVAGVQNRDGLMIRLGAATLLVGILFSIWAMPRGGLVAITLGMLVIGAGFGLSWAFATRRILSGLDEEQQALASSAVPTAQLIGGAVGSAAVGAAANALGFGEGIDPAVAQTRGLWLFALFAPLAVIGWAAAWRLGRRVTT
ncbi:MFS transporter [Caulobacter sp. SLTY]|uniref:MFS transporter n=1 Tax=Caulobacter sp. SLTY TaxID=2683262 RepID=UPI0014131CDF|nr:MFS transporter [Caulobacter sp. SLTY]NBB14071.1 MFS transporter [Caulobacter sp. SLTY]